MILRFHAGQFFLRRAVLEELGQFLIQLFFDLRQIPARLRRRLHAELPGDFVQSHKRVCIGGNLVVVHQALVEPRALPNTQNIAHQVQVVAVGCAVLRHIPNLINPGLRDAILHVLPVGCGHFRDPDLMVRDRRSGGNIAEILFMKHLIPAGQWSQTAFTTSREFVAIRHQG